ncbi:MAG: glycogen-binding domain-containing protein [Balneolaceae bacterium]|nr:glycogen-binding domain-containing protein [Balneolaceae bacterium]
MDQAKEEILRKYLDGDLSAEEEQQALHMIADNEDMRSMLRFEQLLTGTDLSSYEVPEGFGDSVMQAIEVGEEKAMERSPGLADQIREWVSALFEPREIRLRPAFAMAMVLLIAVLVGIPYLTDQPSSEQMASNNVESATVEQVSDSGEQVWTRFVYIDEEAESVSIAGDFSDWNPIELTRQSLNGQQVWTGLIPMDRGEHRYMFIKNGEKWVTDPLAPVQQDDGFGNKNAVIYL